MLYDYSKQIIQTYESLHSKLQELKDIISGTIRVATIYSIGLHDLPPYVKKFMKSYPTVNVHVEYRRANQVYEDVLGNVVDLGLVAYPAKDAKLEIIPASQGAARAHLPSAPSVRQTEERQAQDRWPGRNSSALSRTSPRARRSTKFCRNTASR